MALVNHVKREINAKIVYFGPAASGKRTALNYIYSRIKPSLRGDLKNVPAGGDSLLFFDFSPFDAPLADGYRVRLHVYTLSGPVSNPATWKMILKGTDGVVILVDAADERLAAAQASVAQLRDLLSAYGVGLHDTPTVLQLNDRGREAARPDVERLASALELSGLPACLSATASGEGVLEALTTLSRLVLDRIRDTAALAETAGQPTVSVETESLRPTCPDELHSSRQSATPAVFPTQHEPDGTPHLVPVSPELDDTGTTLRIPLDVTFGGTCRRLVITVAVSSEPNQAAC